MWISERVSFCFSLSLKTEKWQQKAKIAARKPWGRLVEDVQEEIVCKVKSGMLTKRAAGRKYGLPLSTIGNWQENII